MYSVPGPPAEDERFSEQRPYEAQVNNGKLIVWFIRFAIVAYMAGIAARLMADDEVKLHMLHGMIRMFQSIARLFGEWALQTEKAYNEYVESLH